jgi:GrpB-like predicted nucleotidyltransferase (UPF0157 family)
MLVEVVPSSPTWPQEFRREAERLRLALRPEVAAIHHIGSTSVPDLPAKPIIDILMEVESLDRLDERRSRLEQLGYECMGEYGIPGRRYFRKSDSAGIRTHHVHAFRCGDANIERHLAFRDYLIAHPDVARAYGELKLRLAMLHAHDVEAYMDGKDGFIKVHEAAALAWASLTERPG